MKLAPPLCLAAVFLSTFMVTVSARAQHAAEPPAAAGPNPPPSGQQPGGGLAPPPALQTPPPAVNPEVAQTELELERADREDSGRGLEFFWLNGELGAEHLGLQTFRADQLVDENAVSTSGTGVVYGAGLGVRLLIATLGARFRLGNFSAWQLWTLNGEVGFHVPLGQLEPYAVLGAGYASLGGFEAENLRAAAVGAAGFNIRVSAGFDYYLSNTFSVGANLSGDALFLSRSAIAPQAAAPELALYTRAGSSIGAGAALTAVVGFHL